MERAYREVWMPVLDYEEQYEASNLGRIRRAGKGNILVQSATAGYPHVSLSAHGEIRTMRVHRLVLTAFCGSEPFAEAHAAHNNGNPMDCRLANLRWATAVENQADVDRHGHRCRGEEVYGSVLTAAEVKEIRKRCGSGERNPGIAQDFGVSISTIHLIRHNKIWRHVE